MCEEKYYKILFTRYKGPKHFIVVVPLGCTSTRHVFRTKFYVKDPRIIPICPKIQETLKLLYLN